VVEIEQTTSSTAENPHNCADIFFIYPGPSHKGAIQDLLEGIPLTHLSQGLFRRSPAAPAGKTVGGADSSAAPPGEKAQARCTPGRKTFNWVPVRLGENPERLHIYLTGLTLAFNTDYLAGFLKLTFPSQFFEELNKPSGLRWTARQVIVHSDEICQFADSSQ
jgi:hypothetical protein